jgi:sugar phosphate isomerase/epimerase
MAMKTRRSMMRECGLGLLALDGLSLVDSAFAHGNALQQIPGRLTERISISTVTFRDRFKSSASKPPNPSQELTLSTAPKFIADSLGIRNVEVWNLHFEDESIAYCEKVREAAARVGSSIVNIELDGSYNLSSADSAERKKSLQFVKEWIDRANALGSPRVRPNQQSFEAASAPFDLSIAVDSYRELTDYAHKTGVKILVKNFVGACLNIDTLISLIKAVNDPQCRLILDWGNTYFDSMDARLAEFRKAFPYMEMETAKGSNFDANYRLTDYDPAPIIRATEDSGFRGIYSIELYSADNPPIDPVRASRVILSSLIANMSRS